MKFKSTFIKIFQKTFGFDKGLKIFKNGVDNNYAELVEDAIDNSVTASRCVETISDFITGKGFGDELNKIIVHKEKGTTLLQFLQDIGESIAKHKGVYVHCNFNGAYQIKDMDVLPFIDGRVGKADDNDYSGKIHLCKDWLDTKMAKKNKPIDVFNPDQKVIQSQIDKAKGINNYLGQIFFFKYGKFTYPLSPIHAVIRDAQSEAQASLFKNISLTKGFFGKTLIITKPLVDDTTKESDPDEYRNQETERETFKKTINSFMGAENTGGALHIEMEFESDKIEDEFFIKQIDSNINDKLFEHTENSVANNICAALKVPPILIRQKDGTMFASSGEMLVQAKQFVQEQTTNDRMNVEQIINKLMAKFHEPKTDLKIIPLIQTQNNVDNQE